MIKLECKKCGKKLKKEKNIHYCPDSNLDEIKSRFPNLIENILDLDPTGEPEKIVTCRYEILEVGINYWDEKYDDIAKNFGNLKYIYNQKSKNIRIAKCAKSVREIIIPDKIEGNPVVAIDKYTFYECSSLTSIVIPNSVTSIGHSAFSYCSSLTSVVIPNSVTSIGDGAFSHCRSLTSIVIPNGVTSIGHYAFDGCSSLTSIVIPNSVTSIGDSAFWCCSSLTIYARASSKPSGWHRDWNRGGNSRGIGYWNPKNKPVVWGYKGE